jgi:beta-glucosidase
MKYLLLCALAATLALSLPSFAQDGQKNSTENQTHAQGNPTKRMEDQSWKAKHEKLVAKANNTESLLQFFGDSITEGMDGNLDLFERHFEALKPANFGISGDRANELLWRMNNGEMGGHPKIISILIGTNDINADWSEANVARVVKHIQDIVQTAQDRQPEAKILITAIFPRGHKDANGEPDPRMPRIKSTNEELAKMDNGKNIRFVDISTAFLDKDGNIKQPLMPDLLHPSRAGYEAWSDAIRPIIKEMAR